MSKEITIKQKARAQREWSTIAGEELKIKCSYINEPITAFGSELGCLRLHYRMHFGEVKYSTNLKTWYYANKR